MIYSAVVGKKLLELYNKKNNMNLTAKEFFIDVFYPVAFSYPNKWIITVGNSKLSYPVFSPAKVGYPDEKSMEKRLNNFIKSIDNNPKKSVGIGFPANDLMATTSFQNIDSGFYIDSETNYCSWIGGALAVRVSGGFSLFFEDDDILWKIFNGWFEYRKTLNENDLLKGMQVETWNGQWLASQYNTRNKNIVYHDILNNNTDNLEAITTIKWTTLLLRLAMHYPNRNLVCFVSLFGQMNSTVGYIHIKLPEIKKPLDFYIKMFGNNKFFNNVNKIERVFNFSQAFISACRTMQIGISQLELVGIQYLLDKEKTFDKFIKKLDKNDTDIRTVVDVQKTWIGGMMNNSELIELAKPFAQILYDYAYNNENKKRTSINQAEKLLDYKKTYDVNVFNENLDEIFIQIDDTEKLKTLNSIRKALQLGLGNKLIKQFLQNTWFEYILIRKGFDL